jgi:hypothetical protein
MGLEQHITFPLDPLEFTVKHFLNLDSLIPRDPMTPGDRTQPNQAFTTNIRFLSHGQKVIEECNSSLTDTSASNPCWDWVLLNRQVHHSKTLKPLFYLDYELSTDKGTKKVSVTQMQQS